MVNALQKFGLKSALLLAIVVAVGLGPVAVTANASTTDGGKIVAGQSNGQQVDVTGALFQKMMSLDAGENVTFKEVRPLVIGDNFASAIVEHEKGAAALVEDQKAVNGTAQATTLDGKLQGVKLTDSGGHPLIFPGVAIISAHSIVALSAG